MKRLYCLLIVTLLALLIALPAAAQEADPVINRSSAPSAERFTLTPVVQGDLDRPLYITHAGDGSGRLFLVEQNGRIYVLDGTTFERSVFLDVSDLLHRDVFSGRYTERGLLGLAFHPDYEENGTFFINYTDQDGTTNVVRYTVSPDQPDAADPDSAEVIFTQDQPFPNHNGGHMEFGPDGYLYISLGDGGAAGDPLGAGQNPALLLGSLLRIDVDEAPGYAIPTDNPFVDDPNRADEIWAYGLRNVWRFSFDRATGDLYLADVGQNQWEEVNFQPADSPGGENYGWKAYEASQVFDPSVTAEDAVMPIAEYSHAEGCSVTGGYIYRGQAIPDLQGAYLYGDYCSGRMWAAYRDASGAWQSARLMDTDMQISSFGEDEAGELYVIDYGGTVYRFDPAG